MGLRFKKVGGNKMSDILEKENKTYLKNKEELLKDEGKYVLIKGDDIKGIFESKEDAIKKGYEEFGNTPFLVKKIQERDETMNFANNLIRCV